MKRMLAVIAVFGSICLAGSAVAQGPGGPGGFKKKFAPEESGPGSIQRLEAQVEALRIQIRDLDAFLKQGKGGFAREGKGYGRGPGSFEKKGFGPPPGKGPGGPRSFDKGPWGPPPGKGPGGPRGFDKKGPPGFGPPPGKGPGGNSEKKEGKEFGGGFAEKKEGKGFGPGGFFPGNFEKKGFGPGGFNPGNFEKKGFGPGGFNPGGNFEKKEGKSSGPGGTSEKKERKGSGPAAGAPAGPASIEDRLDRILRELEDIRRELKNK